MPKRPVADQPRPTYEDSRSATEAVQERLADVRRARSWNQQQLAYRLDALGSNLRRSALSKIEARLRQVSVDDLLEICAALSVSPLALLTPLDDSLRVAITPKFRVDGPAFRSWVRGTAPLALQGIHDTNDIRAYYEQTPHSEWQAYRRDGVETLVHQVDVLRESGSNTPGEMRQMLDAIERTLNRVRDGLDRSEEDSSDGAR
jgi:transcriptional regulator with XRE-family HTH domain